MAVRIHAHGGPEALRVDDVEVGPPGRGMARVLHTAIGVNFIDTYHRNGIYSLPSLPQTLGIEAAGVVVAVGPDVEDVTIGQRVAYFTQTPGSYAEERLVKVDRLLPIPDAIDDKIAAASLLKGLTAQYLVRRTYPLKTGETAVVHAAAGGVGSLLVQWGRFLGARVIGTVSSPEKKADALANGCEEVFLGPGDDFIPGVKALTGGVGAHVVYDGVGRDAFFKSLQVLRHLGMMVHFGQASGPVSAIEPVVLGQKGSLFLTRPTLHHYFATRQELTDGADDLFAMIENGVLKVRVNQEFPLAAAAEAHRAIEARATTGSTILIP
jgi:NADPH:quinone reductase